MAHDTRMEIAEIVASARITTDQAFGAFQWVDEALFPVGQRWMVAVAVAIPLPRALCWRQQ